MSDTAGDDPTASIDWTKLDFADVGAGGGVAAAGSDGRDGDATPVDLSTLSFGATGNSPTADIFGGFSVGDDPFAASSPMAQIDFGFGSGGAFDDADAAGGAGGGGEDATIAAGRERRAALEAQLTELSLKLETLKGPENKNRRKKTTAKIKDVEAKLEELKKLHGDDIFGGFSFDPSAFDPSASTGIDARHPVFSRSGGGGGGGGSGEGGDGGGGDADGEDEDGGGEVDDSLLKLPDEPLEGEAAPSGHEEEDELFRCRSKLHRFFKEHAYGGEVRENVWFDMGRGDCVVLRHRNGEGNSGGVVRLVFRQELTQKVKSNFRLNGVLATHSGPNRVVISNALSRTPVEDEYANVGEDKLEVQNISFKFRQPADADQLLALCAAENPALPTNLPAPASE